MIRVEQGKGRKDRYAMLSPQSARAAARLVAGRARLAGLAVSRAASPVKPITTRQLNRACHAAAQAGRDREARVAAHAAAQLCHPPAWSRTSISA